MSSDRDGSGHWALKGLKRGTNRDLSKKKN